MSVRAAALALVGTLIAGCYFSRSPTRPVPALFARTSGGEHARCLVVFVPGLLDGPDSFVEHDALAALAESGAPCDAVGVDWTVDLSDARRRVGSKVALQGNLDPAALAAPPVRIRQLVADILADFGPGSGHVFNLGHGIQPWADPEHVRALVEAVHEASGPYHTAAGS